MRAAAAVTTAVAAAAAALAFVPGASAGPLDFAELPACSLTSVELRGLAEEVQPCVLYDEGPKQQGQGEVVTLVQVTPSTCAEARDGALVAVEKLNAQNVDRGMSIGYLGDTYIKLRFVSVIAGYPNSNATAYTARHVALLEGLLSNNSGLDASFIVGSCSSSSSHEREVAMRFGRVLMAQVGPPSYYDAESSFVFGIHVSSDQYTAPALQAISFAWPNATVGILARDRSGFFNSTCHAAARHAAGLGLRVTHMDFYNPEGDHDGDGVLNHLDQGFMEARTDQICGPGGANPDVVVACVLTNVEGDVLMERMGANGCKPKALWLTSALWGWGLARPEVTPYMFGGGQWHEQFRYGDEFFRSGKALQQYGESRFGYFGSYDLVASYTIPYVFAKALETHFRTQDAPQVQQELSAAYEGVRRTLLQFNAETIFGRVSFNSLRRNDGRAPSGSQFLPDSAGRGFTDTCISPAEEARASPVIPAPNNAACPAGAFTDATRIASETCLMCDKCSLCPPGSSSPLPGQAECAACPEGSTAQEPGARFCTQVEDNMLPVGVQALGFLMVGTNWLLALGFAGWAYKHRADPVVRISQGPFLYLVCAGTFVSSSTILALMPQASSSDTDMALVDAACVLAPWLYCMGFTLSFGALCAKSYRLSRYMNNPKLERIAVSACDVAVIILVVMCIDAIILTSWTVRDPLHWQREELTTQVDQEAGTVTIESIGFCGTSELGLWVFLGPLAAVHVALMASTFLVLYKIRTVSQRYQERKYLALALFSALELTLVGLPVLAAVGGWPVVRFLVLATLVFGSDASILLFLFVPKIKFQRKGLPPGVRVQESLQRYSSQPPRRSRAESVDSRHGGGGGGGGMSPRSAHSGQGAQDTAEVARLKLEVDQLRQRLAQFESSGSSSCLEGSSPTTPDSALSSASAGVAAASSAAAPSTPVEPAVVEVSLA